MVCEMAADADCALSTWQRMRLPATLENRIRRARVEICAIMEEVLDVCDPDRGCTIPTALVRSMAADMDDSDVHISAGLDLTELPAGDMADADA